MPTKKKLHISIIIITLAICVLAGCSRKEMRPAPEYVPVHTGVPKHTPKQTENLERPKDAQTVSFTPGLLPEIQPPAEETPSASENSPAISAYQSVPEDIYDIHFLDVGQADCTIIHKQGSEEAILIDAGNYEDGTYIVRYLRDLGVTQLKYIIATHPHEDHIGGMAEVLHNYVPDLLIMPYVSYETAAFERLDKAIESLQIDTGEPRPKDTYAYGESTLTIIHPRMNQKYEDINDYSVGVRWDFGQSSMIACGDATEIAESDMLLSPRQLQADIYKVNHHGSDTSSSILYLAAMSPSYAVISCGEFNDYGHPHEAVLKRLSKLGVAIYRTDLSGTIIASCSNDTISFAASD